jgi:hypothetical protein
MATRLDETAALKKKGAPAKKSTAAKKGAAAAPKAKATRAAVPRKPMPAQEPVAGKKAGGLLRAGLKALDTVRSDVAKRQVNLIEGLLGIGQGKVGGDGAKGALTRGFASLDTFGIRKFEDVFDQRVATALQRLGVPSAQEVQALREEVVQLRERLAQCESRNAGSRAVGKR